MTIDQIGKYNSYYVNGNSWGTTVFYMEGNNVVLYPTPTDNSASVNLRLKYYRRPNELVPFNEGAIIQTVDTGTDTISVSAVPDGWAIGNTVDIVNNGVPFEIVAEGITITNIVGTDITFNSGDVDNVTVGNTIALEGFSITPNISNPDAHRLLEQACLVRLFEGLDDESGIQTAAALYERYLTSFLSTITPRADSSPKKVISTNSLYYRRRGRY